MMEKEALRVENACGRFLKLAVLDRPTRGLDENGCKELQEILLDLANHGMAVVVLDTRKRNLRDLCSEVAEF